jgi:hypothetical protein
VGNTAAPPDCGARVQGMLQAGAESKDGESKNELRDFLQAPLQAPERKKARARHLQLFLVSGACLYLHCITLRCAESAVQASAAPQAPDRSPVTHETFARLRTARSTTRRARTCATRTSC